MKSLIYIVFWLTTIVAAGLAGCSPAEKFLRTDTSEIEIAARGDNRNIPVEISSSSSWMIDFTALADWVECTYEEDSPAIMWVRVPGANESLEARSDTIVIVSGDGLTLAIRLVQLAMDARFEVTPASIEPFGARDETKRTLTVSTDFAWEYSALHGAEWIKVVRGTEEAAENSLTVGVLPTRDLDPRRDTLVIRPVGEAFHSLADSIAVVQAGIDLLVDSELMNTDTYDIEVAAEGGEAPMYVYSRAAWRVSTEAPAEKVAIDLEEGSADIENGIPVVVTVARNDSTEEFAFTLVFESAGEKYEYQFVQAGAAEPETEPESTPEI